MDAHATATGGDGSWREGSSCTIVLIINLITLDDDVACLTDHLGAVVHHVLIAIGARVFSNLSDAGSACLHGAALAGGLQANVRSSDHDGGASGKEVTATVNITNNNLRGGDDDTVVVAHITALLHLGDGLKFHLLDFGFALPNLLQVLFHTVGKGRQLLFPFFENIVHLVISIHNYQ